MTSSRTASIFVLVFTAVGLAAGNGYKLFQQGLAKERAEADLRGAIQIYEQVVKESATDRKLAAQALFRMAECQRILGDAQAHKTYERLVGGYADQKEVFVEAQAHLAAMKPSTASLSMRQIWSGDGVDETGGPSPDGRYFVFTDWDTNTLRVRDLQSGQIRQITPDPPKFEGPYYSRFSPNGRQVAYQWFGSKGHSLRLVGCDGSNTRVLTQRQDELVPAAWSPDGRQIAVVLTNPDKTHQIALVSTADGATAQLKSTSWRWPEVGGFSPDGRFLVYSIPDSDSKTDDGGIFLLAADGSREIPLVQGTANDSGPVWTPDGRSVVFESDRSGSNALWSIRVAEGKPEGVPELVRANVGDIHVFGFDRKGSYYYSSSNRQVDVYWVELDPKTLEAKTQPRRLADKYIGSNWGPSWSPDGNSIAFFRALDDSRERAVVIRSVVAGEERTLPVRVRQGVIVTKGFLTPQWFPDGRSILVLDTADARWTFKRVDIETGEASVVLSGTKIRPNTRLSPDGKSLYFTTRGETGLIFLMKKDLHSGEEKELYSSESPGVGFFGLAVSADGKRVAFMRNDVEEGKRTLFAISSEGGLPKQLYRGGYQKPTLFASEWTRDGRQLIIASDANNRGLLWAVPAEGGEPKPLNVQMRQILDPAIAPDGERMAFTAAQSECELWVIDNLMPEIRASR